MITTEEIDLLFDESESEQVEFKAVLPPARNLARDISAFSNSNGGHIVLGVLNTNNEKKVVGLSSDFNANSVLFKAVEMLSDTPDFKYYHVNYQNKKLFIIEITSSSQLISLNGKIYHRIEGKTKEDEVDASPPETDSIIPLKEFGDFLYSIQNTGTDSKLKFVDHYLSVFKIIDDLGEILYPISSEVPTDNQEGVILNRILFASCADNFEIYLTDLLYEIFLAKPETLKSESTVTVKEVLDCSDMQEFVKYIAKKKLNKLQRGSVKAFTSENKQIKHLNVLNDEKQNEIEKILQIRHLYTHKNGRIDEKFLNFFPDNFQLNDEHKLSLESLLDMLKSLCLTVNELDDASILKYSLDTV